MSIEISPSLSGPKPAIKLWTPNTIGVLTFLLGFPAGIALATTNWIKMRMTRKAIPHILLGIAGIVAIILLPDAVGRIVGIALSWGYLAFLRGQMKSDIEKLDGLEVRNAHWLGGIFLSAALYGVVFVGVIVFVWLQSFYESITPGHALYYSNRGDEFLSSGNYDLAIAEYTQAIDLDPTLPSLYYNRGLAYGSQGRYDLAIVDFTRSIELEPGYADNYNNRCLSYYLLGKYEQALPDCEQALILAPDTDYTLDLRASLYVALGRKEDAIKDFEHVLEITTDQDFITHAQEELKKLKNQ